MTTSARRNEGFPSSLRIRKRREFSLVRREGRVKHTSHFIVIARQNQDGPTRLGLTVSRKVGGAVQRNRVKRLIREFFRKNHHCMEKSIDLSIIAKRGASGLPLNNIIDQLLPVVSGLCRDDHAK